MKKLAAIDHLDLKAGSLVSMHWLIVSIIVPQPMEDFVLIFLTTRGENYNWIVIFDTGRLRHFCFESGFGKFLLKIPIFSTSGWKKYLQVGLKRTHVKDETASHLQRSKVWRGQGPSRHQRHTKAGNICCFRATLPGGAWVPTLALRIMSTWSQQPHMLFYIIVTSFVFWLKPYSERLVPLNLCNLQYSVLCWSFTNGRSFMK